MSDERARDDSPPGNEKAENPVVPKRSRWRQARKWIGALGGIGGLITLVAFGRDLLSGPDRVTATITADVLDVPFRVPSAVLGIVDDMCSDLTSTSRGDSAVYNVISANCYAGDLFRDYTAEIRRFVEINLRNDGAVTARNVSVRVPVLTVAQWRREGSKPVQVPYQRFSGTRAVEIGDVRPAEGVVLHAWTGDIPWYDSVAVLLDQGRVSIRERRVTPP